jgi:hypothetical protein
MNENIIQYNDFFSFHLLDEMQTYIYDTSKSESPYMGRTNMCWQDFIVGHSAPVIIIDLPNTHELNVKIKSEIKNKLGKEPANIMFYIWTKLSYIPWHNDSHVKGALTVYLNEYWDDNWGGYFMYKNENEEISAIKPKTNLGIVQMGELKHSVSTININAENRITLQTFFN